MALLHAKPKPYRPHQPHRAIPSPHRSAGMHATPRANPVLSNLATISGGTPPSNPPSQGAVGGGGAGAAPGQSAPAPWASDPVLQMIQNLQQANIAAAEAQSVAARNQALINFGYDPGMASLYDKNTGGAAKANPYSILAQLQHGHELRQTGLNENLNKANLFYSSTRGQQLGEEGRQYLGQQYGAGQNLQGLLSQINEKRLGAYQGAQEAITQGTQGAYDRWLNQQLQYGLGAYSPKPPKPKAQPKPYVPQYRP